MKAVLAATTPRRRGACRRRASGRARWRWASGQLAGPAREEGSRGAGWRLRRLSRSRVCTGDPTTECNPVDSGEDDRRDPGCRAARPAGGLAGAAAARWAHSRFQRCWEAKGTRSIRKDLCEPGDHHGKPAFGGLHTGLTAGRSSPLRTLARSGCSLDSELLGRSGTGKDGVGPAARCTQGPGAAVQTSRPKSRDCCRAACGNCPTSTVRRFSFQMGS